MTTSNYCNADVLVFNAKVQFKDYAKQKTMITKIYNANADESFKEETTVNYHDFSEPNLCMTFSISGIKGGISVERLLGNEKFALISFAGIEKKYRRKGVLTKNSGILPPNQFYWFGGRWIAYIAKLCWSVLIGNIFCQDTKGRTSCGD